MTDLSIRPYQNHLMIDLETFSLAPNAAVWELGYAHNFNEPDKHIFCDAVFIQSELFNTKGFDVDPRTVAWVEDNCPSFKDYGRWVQDNAPADVQVRRDAMRYDLTLISDLIKNADHVWCKGADFDFPILKNLYYQAGVALPPMMYRKQRCFRTLWAMCNESTYKVDPVLAHGAASDALFQLKGTISVLEDFEETERAAMACREEHG